MYLWLFKFFIDKWDHKWFQNICWDYYNIQKCTQLEKYYFDINNNKLLNDTINENMKIALFELKYWLFHWWIFSRKIILNSLLNNTSKKRLVENIWVLNIKWSNLKKLKCNKFNEEVQVFTTIKGWEHIKELCLFIKSIDENK
jgi:hypothetical protein